ncbi:GDP-L-fucose synthase [Acidimicrobiia bacterium]|nr:GDP-L-fucose synthase [Acidimicrobiia bacterium]
MKVLVFGSNGLVGNSLRRNFSNSEEYECLFSTREDTNLFSFQDTKKTISKFNPDLIINAAAKVGGIYANDTQGTSFLIENLKININILESIINLPKVSLINLGSSCIYPLNAPNPISENSFMGGVLEPTNSPYAMAKLTAIELGKTLKKDYGHSIINLMPTNLYGPHDNFDDLNSHVIPGLISRMHQAKLKNERDFNIWGTGKPLREFLYVDDLAEAIKFISKEKINIDLINVGSGVEISIKELAEKIKLTIGFNGKLNFDSKMPDGNPRKLLDSSLINKNGWFPKIDLDQGLKDTYSWYLENS